MVNWVVKEGFIEEEEMYLNFEEWVGFSYVKRRRGNFRLEKLYREKRM